METQNKMQFGDAICMASNAVKEYIDQNKKIKLSLRGIEEAKEAAEEEKVWLIKNILVSAMPESSTPRSMMVLIEKVHMTTGFDFLPYMEYSKAMLSRKKEDLKELKLNGKKESLEELVGREGSLTNSLKDAIEELVLLNNKIDARNSDARFKLFFNRSREGSPFLATLFLLGGLKAHKQDRASVLRSFGSSTEAIDKKSDKKKLALLMKRHAKDLSRVDDLQKSIEASRRKVAGLESKLRAINKLEKSIDRWLDKLVSSFERELNAFLVKLSKDDLMRVRELVPSDIESGVAEIMAMCKKVEYLESMTLYLEVEREKRLQYIKDIEDIYWKWESYTSSPVPSEIKERFYTWLEVTPKLKGDYLDVKLKNISNMKSTIGNFTNYKYYNKVLDVMPEAILYYIFNAFSEDYASVEFVSEVLPNVRSFREDKSSPSHEVKLAVIGDRSKNLVFDAEIYQPEYYRNFTFNSIAEMRLQEEGVDLEVSLILENPEFSSQFNIYPPEEKKSK